MEVNQFFNAGVALMLLGSVLAYLRWVPSATRGYAARKFTVTIELHDHDSAFEWLTAWLSKHMGDRQTCGEWTIATKAVGPDEAPSIHYAGQQNEPRKRREVQILYSPAPGWHLVRFNGRRVVVHRIRTQKEHGGYKGYTEMFVLRTWGQQGRETIRQILEAGRAIVEGEESSHFQIYQGQFQDWVALASCEPRPLESIILADNTLDELLDDIKQFLSRKAWYAARGIPYRRGYLLHGAPGNGKSSLVSAIAGYFGMDIYVAPISSSWMDDNHLSALIRRVPAGGILLMEDIDCAFPESRSENPKAVQAAAKEVGVALARPTEVTLSGLLNVIDGIAAPEGRILFMTTNHPEVLDPAILRKGRIDKQFELKSATKTQAERLYAYFYHDQPVNGVHAKAFAEQVLTHEDTSMAAIQGVLLDYPDDPHGVLAATAVNNQ